MKIPCPVKAPCLDDANPFQNLSSEAPDINRFFAYGSGPGRVGHGTTTGPGSVGPGPGQNWNASCQTPDGPISCAAATIEEAELCVERLGQLCAAPPDAPPDPDQPQDPSGPTDPVEPLFFNAFQFCQSTCPDGTPFTFQVMAGAFVATSQIVADREAFSFACRQAQLQRVCLSALTPTNACAGKAYSGTLHVTGGTGFTFSIVGGSLPPGINMSFVGNTVLLSGTPTTPGNYSFTIRALNNVGHAVVRGYTIFVLGFTNPPPTNFIQNTPYSFQMTAAGGVAPYTFAIQDGSLPVGLTMSDAGLISGTPTSNSDTSFTCAVTDSA